MHTSTPAAEPLKSLEQLRSLQRGELAATETYQQALEKIEDVICAELLRQIHRHHREAANTLRQEVRRLGGEPVHDSGTWGMWAKAVEGTAKLLGVRTALAALRMGEEYGAAQYEKALGDADLPDECKMLIRMSLLPQTHAHIAALGRLMG